MIKNMTIYGTANEEIAKEMESRISDDIRHFKGKLPEIYSAAWHGYIAGLYEWKVLSLSSYKHLVSILPTLTNPDPIAEIFAGRDDNE